MKGVVTFLLTIFSSTLIAADWSDEQQEVIEFLESVPQAYRSGSFTEYMTHYHPEFTNWYMSGEKVQSYNEIKANLKRSFEGRYKIMDSRVTPISIEIDDDRAFVRYVEKELAADTTTGDEAWGRYHFVAILKRGESGRWQLYRANIDIVETPTFLAQ